MKDFDGSQFVFQFGRRKRFCSFACLIIFVFAKKGLRLFLLWLLSVKMKAMDLIYVLSHGDG